MRADISQVLVDTLRTGRADARAVAGSRRRARQRLDRDGEGAPARFGMQRDRYVCKGFGDHLGPLYRYLRKQANRPWAKVYSEICAVLDRRSVVQAHVLQHLRDKVDLDTVWHQHGVWVRIEHRLVPLAQANGELFVHPRTGILLVNRARLIARRQGAR